MQSLRLPFVGIALTLSFATAQLLAQGSGSQGNPPQGNPGQGNPPIRCSAPGKDPNFLDPDIQADCAYSSNNPAAMYSPTGGQLLTVPVWFHVIRKSDGTGNVPLTQLQNQIAILNEDFRAISGTPGAGGVDTRIQFVLAGYDYTTSNSWYADKGTYFNTLAKDTRFYCNVYTNSAGGNLGYVSGFPAQGNLVGSRSDRIVVLWSTVGRNAPYGAPYNQGRTLTHEMGHYLGLYHTFQGGCTNTNCNANGDLICDTPPEASPFYGCGSRDSCSSAGTDPTTNYMDYSQDACMNNFTEAQARRMRCTLTSWRTQLYTASFAAGAFERHVIENPPSYYTNVPTIGTTLAGHVTLTTTGHSAALVFGSLAPTNTLLPNGFRQLIDTTGPVLLLGTVTDPTGFQLPIPAVGALDGLQLFTQAMHLGGQADFALSNAVDLTLHW